MLNMLMLQKTKLHSLLLVPAILLCLAIPSIAFDCKNCIRSTPSAQPLDWKEWKRTSGLKPAFITEEEMVRGMVAGSLAPQRQPDYATATIARWESPIRVRLLDGNDDDLPLDESPGKEIAEYLRNIGQELGLSITITTREKQDNNVSIVLGWIPKPNSGTAHTSVKNVYSSRWFPKPIPYIDPETTTIGTIMGVPELVGEAGGFKAAYRNSYVKHYEDDQWHGGALSYNEDPPITMIRRYVPARGQIKACIIFTTFDWSTKTNFIVEANSAAKQFNACLGPMRVNIRFVPASIFQRSQIEASISARTFFRFKLLYDPAVKSGMSTTDAEQFFAQKIKSAQ